MAAGAMGMVPGALLANDSIQPTPFVQTPLPYAYNALEPYVDAMTMEIHHTKHAAAYTKNLNDAALAEFKGENTSLETALSNISKYSAKLRNNGGGYLVEAVNICNILMALIDHVSELCSIF